MTRWGLVESLIDKSPAGPQKNILLFRRKPGSLAVRLEKSISDKLVRWLVVRLNNKSSFFFLMALQKGVGKPLNAHYARHYFCGSACAKSAVLLRY